jgi:hypothetical protein
MYQYPGTLVAYYPDYLFTRLVGQYQAGADTYHHLPSIAILK